jgi:hypothetical protein
MVDDITISVIPLCATLSAQHKAAMVYWILRWRATKVVYPCDDSRGKAISEVLGFMESVSTYAAWEDNLQPPPYERMLYADAVLVLTSEEVNIGETYILAKLLLKADAQYVSVYPDGFQDCSANPDEFVLPRKGALTSSKLIETLLNARNAGLISPEAAMAAFEVKRLPAGLAQALAAYQDSVNPPKLEQKTLTLPPTLD